MGIVRLETLARCTHLFHDVLFFIAQRRDRGGAPPALCLGRPRCLRWFQFSTYHDQEHQHEVKRQKNSKMGSNRIILPSVSIYFILPHLKKLLFIIYSLKR